MNDKRNWKNSTVRLRKLHGKEIDFIDKTLEASIKKKSLVGEKDLREVLSKSRTKKTILAQY